MKISNFVAYIKQAWKNKPDSSTPLSAERLSHMESGIKGNSDAIEAIAAAVVSQIVNDPNKIVSMAALYAVDKNKADKENAVLKNPELQFAIGNETGEVSFRRTGGTGSYGLSLVFKNADGGLSYYGLVENDGSRSFPPLSHKSGGTNYGAGDTSNYGHCKIVNALTKSSYAAGEALAAYQGYLLNNKIGNIQILSIAGLNITDTASVADGGAWSATGTITPVPGASGYYFIPLSCNFGFVSKVTVSGTTVTCNATNASGGRHSCTVSGLVVAYKKLS